MSTEIITANVSSDALAKKHEWITERDALITQSAEVAKVDSDADVNMAGALQTKMSKHIKELEKERKAVTAPLDAVKKEIMAQEKELRAKLLAERDRLKALNDAYATKLYEAEQARKREAEEQARLQAMRDAEELQKASEAFGEDVQVAVTEAPQIAEPEKVKMSGNRTVKRWSFEMVDSSMVPTDYLVLNDKAVRAYIKMAESMDKEPDIPGIKFTARISVESK